MKRPQAAWASNATSSSEKLPQLKGIGRRGAFLIAVEIDEHVAALFLPAGNALGPVLKNLGAIMALVPAARSMPSQIDKIGRAFAGRRSVVVVRQAERNILPG
jgi:hypothetical protein